jgi:F-type H+-transporting ATPase subunit epsilon
MADTFQFDLVTPERLFVSAKVSGVIVPGAEGDFMVLPGHAPFISMLRPGLLVVPELDGQCAEALPKLAPTG